MQLPRPESLGEILSVGRVATALSALSDPSHGPTDAAFDLTQEERATIQDALHESDHLLARFAEYLIDEWDETAPDDRVAGLLLFQDEGNLKYKESIGEGLENAADLFRGMLKGKNFGKQLVKVADED